MLVLLLRSVTATSGPTCIAAARTRRRSTSCVRWARRWRLATAGLVFHVTGKHLPPCWHCRGRAVATGA